MERFLFWAYSLIILYVSSFRLTAGAGALICLIAFLLVVADFFTGVLASFHEKKQAKITKSKVVLKSRRMRWSLAKLAVYLVVISGTLFIGHALHTMEFLFDENTAHLTEIENRKEILKGLIWAIRVEAYFICWIELVSNVENLRRIAPKNLLLRYIHYILAFEVIKKIPKLSDMLKEKDEKNMFCEEFDNTTSDEKRDSDTEEGTDTYGSE